MSFAIPELSRLLARDQAIVGIVVSLSGGIARIATERGATTARSLEPLAVGDRVRIVNGVASTAPAAKQAFAV